MASFGVHNWWVLGVGAALLVSCLSPTLPMPPPSRPEIEGPDASGVVVLSGYAPPESWVNARNMTTGYSFGQLSHLRTGAYRFPILASIGDRIAFNYRVDAEDSDAIEFAIPTYAAYPRGTGGGSGTLAGAAGAAGSGNAGAAGASADQSGTAGAP